MNTKHPCTVTLVALALALSASSAAGEVKGIHIPAGRNVGGQWQTTDSAGFRWDIHCNQGTINDGTNDAYDGGMRLRVNNNTFSWHSSGKLSKDGREIEIGPWSSGNVRVWRRIYVDKEASYCRWIDIYENTSATAQSVSLRYYTNLGASTQSVFTSSGGTQITPDDWAFITAQPHNRPAIVHVFATKKAKVRPRIQWQMNNDHVYYHATLKIPARKTVAMCFIHAQRRPEAEARKFLKTFKLNAELKKIPPPLRRIILNFRLPSLFGEIELDRSESADGVIVAGGPIYGTVTNEKFTLEETVFGAVNLPAEKIVGMVAGKGEGAVRVLLADGQILSGKLTGKLNLQLAAGGTLQIPFADIRQWSFRISKKRPDAEASFSPHVIFTAGDRLRIDAGKLDVPFVSAYGTLTLKAGDLLQIHRDKPAGKCSASFLNGSKLTGQIEAAKLTLAMTLGQASDIPRKDIVRFQFAPEDAENTQAPNVARVVMKNKDELCGHLAEEKLSVRTGYGALEISTGSVKSIEFGKAGQDRAIIRLWDGSTLRGKLAHEHLNVELAKGITLKLPVGQIVTLARSHALPAAELVARVEKLIGQLGANDYKTRQTATEAILKLGPAVIPVLRKRKDHDDPEVRRRISDIIEKLE